MWLALLVLGVHVCGNYCGPHWCAGQDVDESRCDGALAPETWQWTGVSCADACCRAHDMCCGHNASRSGCNREMVACLDGCHALSASCTRAGVPVPAGAIEAAMGIIEAWCCGKPCPAHSLARGRASESHQ